MNFNEEFPVTPLMPALDPQPPTPFMPALTLDQPTPTYVIQVCNETQMIVGVKPNGDVEFGEGFTADDAAKKFWEILGQSYPFASAKVYLAEVVCEKGCDILLSASLDYNKALASAMKYIAEEGGMEAWMNLGHYEELGEGMKIKAEYDKRDLSERIVVIEKDLE